MAARARRVRGGAAREAEAGVAARAPHVAAPPRARDALVAAGERAPRELVVVVDERERERASVPREVVVADERAERVLVGDDGALERGAARLED